MSKYFKYPLDANAYLQLPILKADGTELVIGDSLNYREYKQCQVIGMKATIFKVDDKILANKLVYLIVGSEQLWVPVSDLKLN